MYVNRREEGRWSIFQSSRAHFIKIHLPVEVFNTDARMTSFRPAARQSCATP